MSLLVRRSFATSLADEAYLQIREKILRGSIPMGGVISRRQIAKELSMSFIPVNEALQRLESEGMVESKPRVGTRVRVPTPNDIRERYIIREALETQSARLFCERASSLERDGLKDMARRLDEEALKVPTSPSAQYAFQAFHLQFHMQIAQWAGSNLLCDMLEKNQLLVFNWLFDVNAESKMPSNWHADLAEVLTSDDPDAAVLAMGTHIRTGMSDIQEAIARRFSSGLPPIGRVDRVSSVSLSAQGANVKARKSLNPLKSRPKRNARS